MAVGVTCLLVLLSAVVSAQNEMEFSLPTETELKQDDQEILRSAEVLLDPMNDPEKQNDPETSHQGKRVPICGVPEEFVCYPVRNPPQLCGGFKQGGRACLQFYSMQATRRSLSGCARLVVRLFRSVAAKVNLGCFRMTFLDATDPGVETMELPYFDNPNNDDNPNFIGFNDEADFGTEFPSQDVESAQWIDNKD